MRPHVTWLLAFLVVGCGGADEYETPALPPPPPPAPAAEPAPLPEPYSEANPAASSTSSSPAAPPTAPPPPSSAAASAPSASGPTASVPAPPPPSAPSSESSLVYAYPTGQWVYMSGSGWVWIPANSTTEEMEGVPYVYLYTPAYGWTWYVSPWGWGPYHYGVWVRHPWHPIGLHGYWVAHPHVVVRLGPRHFRR